MEQWSISREEDSIVIAFLRSSYLTKSHKLYIGFYEGEFLWRRKNIRRWYMEQLYKDMGQVSSIGWYEKNNKNAWGGAYEMPKQFLFPIEKHMYTVFTDIITFPTFMVSSMVRDVIKLYNPFLRYVRIIMMVVRNLLPFGKS